LTTSSFHPDSLRFAPLLSCAALFACVHAGSGPVAPGPVAIEDGRLVMGTVLDVSMRVPPGEEERGRAAIRSAIEIAVALEDVASSFDPASALGRMNARAGQGGATVDPRLYDMLVRAEEGRAASHGAFEVSIGPLVALWTDAARRNRTPSPAEVASARALVAPITLVRGRAGLARPGMSVDLGGLAKGFALDHIATDLAERGIHSVLLDFGGSSIWAGGQPWRLAIESDAGHVLGIVEIEDRALSMSSSLSQSSVIEGVRYGHVVDPRTGQALSARRSAVVVASDAALAEILSTALLVLDEAEAREVLAGQAADGWVRGEDGSTWQTPGWAAATRWSVAPD